jgi:hypothetical protein
MKYESPESSRVAIPTHLRLIKPPARKFTFTSILSLVFLAVSIAVVGCELMRQRTGSPEDGKSILYNTEMNRGIIYLNYEDEPEENGHQVNIPTLTGKDHSRNNQSRKQQLEESLENIKIFEFLHSSKVNNKGMMEQYFIKIQPLYAVKHPKFTSPHQDS